MKTGVVNSVNGAVLECALKQKLLTKEQRYKERISMIERGKQSDNKDVNAAAVRLERNNVAVERAELSKHVYDSKNIPIPEVPEGWHQLSDEEMFSTFGIPAEEMNNPETGFKASIYMSEFEGDKKYVVAFAGTEGIFNRDMVDNLKQGAAFESIQYTHAMRIANQVSRAVALSNKIPNKAVHSTVEFTGHSLGGGLASAASVVTNAKATTFNSAGLSMKTCLRHGISPNDFSDNIDNIDALYSESDPLSIGQDSRLSLGVNKAVGNRYKIPVAPAHQHSWNELILPMVLSAFEPVLGFSSALLKLAKMGGDGHSISVMKSNIEHQKGEDANILLNQ